jgi:hypothetical protein
MNTADWPFNPTPPELRGLSQDELRFYRLIEEREDTPEGQTVLLACGHSIVQSFRTPEAIQYMACAQCVAAWIRAERAHDLRAKTV